MHITLVIMCNFKQLGKYQVKDMNVYIEPLIDELLKLWADITMYDVCKPIRQEGISIPWNTCMDNS
jgi:hypothetical protein